MAKAKKKSPRVGSDSKRKILRAIDAMQDMAPGTVTEIKGISQSQGRTPWLMAVRFIFPKGSSYDDIFESLRDWRDDTKIERDIGSDRLSRIQVRYKDKLGRGAHGEYTLSEIGSWELVVSRATERVGIRDDRMPSLMERYGQEANQANPRKASNIESLIVWFSSATAREVKIGRKTKAKAKKTNKSRRGI